MTATVVDRVATPRGEWVLRRDGERWEIIANGVFLMDTSAGDSERLLVTAALDAVDHGDIAIAIGGLGVGFSLAEAVAHPRVTTITVIEIEPALVAWHRTHLAHITGNALDDSRVHVETTDIADWLRSPDPAYDAICLDVDNGPHWTVTPTNAEIYGAEATQKLRDKLRPGGALTVWSAAAVPEYAAVLHHHFATVRELAVPVARGEPDVVYCATGGAGGSKSYRSG